MGLAFHLFRHGDVQPVAIVAIGATATHLLTRCRTTSILPDILHKFQAIVFVRGD